MPWKLCANEVSEITVDRIPELTACNLNYRHLLILMGSLVGKSFPLTMGLSGLLMLKDSKGALLWGWTGAVMGEGLGAAGDGVAFVDWLGTWAESPK